MTTIPTSARSSHTHTTGGTASTANGGHAHTVDVSSLEAMDTALGNRLALVEGMLADNIIATKALDARLTALETPIIVPPPVDPPPVIPPATGVYGSAIAADGKDNRPIGRSDDSHLAFRWRSEGGTITSLAFNQRFGPDQANPGMGYSHGTGGTIRISLVKAVNGLPDAVAMASIIHQPANPRTDDEHHEALPFGWTIPAGDYCWVFDNVHPDPTNNWMSANCIWVGTPDSPRQPLDPTDTLAVLDRTSSHGWRLYGDNTPCFDVTFADGHHEGQAYTQVITGSEVVISGAGGAVRERFTYSGPDRTFSGVAIRVQRMSGTGVLAASIAGVIRLASVDAIPVASGLTGGRWVRIPLAVTLRQGQPYTLTLTSTATLKFMPISPAIPTDNPPWASRHFTDGRGEKLVGGTWQPLYDAPSGPDLQFWFVP